MKKAFIILLILMVIPFCLGAEELPQACKKHAFGIKGGYHWYPNSSFFKDWQLNKEDFNSTVFELEYEYKYNDKLVISFPIGTHTGSGSGKVKDSWINLKIKNHYFAPTAKLYIPTHCKSLSAFLGGGIGLFYTDMDYTTPGIVRVNETKSNIGFHVTLGLEINLNKDYGVFTYNWPVSLFIENRYSWVEQEKIDVNFINELKSKIKSLKLDSHDIKAGGNTLVLGIKYHF